MAKMTVIHGDGSFELEVVGESHYQRALARTCRARLGGPHPDGVEIETVAILIPEPENPHDANAVRVIIDDRTVGYLARAEARLYRRLLEEGSLPEGPVACAALIRGGWDRGPGDRGFFGVRLDVPDLRHVRTIPLAALAEDPEPPIRISLHNPRRGQSPGFETAEAVVGAAIELTAALSRTVSRMPPALLRAYRRLPDWAVPIVWGLLVAGPIVAALFLVRRPPSPDPSSAIPVPVAASTLIPVTTNPSRAPASPSPPAPPLARPAPPRRPAPPPDAAAPERVRLWRAIGSEVRLGGFGLNEFPIAPNEGAWRAMRAAIQAGDKGAFTQLALDGRMLIVGKDERVSLLMTNESQGYAMIRILSGEHAGRSGFILIKTVHPLD